MGIYRFLADVQRVRLLQKPKDKLNLSQQSYLNLEGWEGGGGEERWLTDPTPGHISNGLGAAATKEMPERRKARGREKCILSVNTCITALR